MGESNFIEVLSRTEGIATQQDGFFTGKQLYVISEEFNTEEGIKYTGYVSQADSVFVFGTLNPAWPYKLP